MRREPLALDVLVREAAHDFTTLAPDRPLSVALADDLPLVLGDADGLRQVLTNLLANARMHTPPGTAVQIVAAQSISEADHVVLIVSDAGPGLTTQQEAQVFERFYRAQPSRPPAARGAGVGLGLLIIAAIVTAHGGTVRLDTAPGAGARFTVSLPTAADRG